jgi:hypothetical protein
MGLVTAILATAALGGAAYSGYQQKRAGDRSEKEGDRARRTAQQERDRIEGLAASAETKRSAAENAAIGESVRQQRMRAGLMFGSRGGTVLTTPLGITGSPAAQGKTALGL